MANLAEKAFLTYEEPRLWRRFEPRLWRRFEPRLWRRFVDDVIAIVTKETGKKLLKHLNSQPSPIKFTLDEEAG